MKLIAKILGSIIGFILYPFFWLLEWVLLFIAAILRVLENFSTKKKSNSTAR